MRGRTTSRVSSRVTPRRRRGVLALLAALLAGGGAGHPAAFGAPPGSTSWSVADLAPYAMFIELWPEMWARPYAIGSSGMIVTDDADPQSWMIEAREVADPGAAVLAGTLAVTGTLDLGSVTIGGVTTTMRAVEGALTGFTGASRHMIGFVIEFSTVAPDGAAAQLTVYLPVRDTPPPPAPAPPRAPADPASPFAAPPPGGAAAAADGGAGTSCLEPFLEGDCIDGWTACRQCCAQRLADRIHACAVLTATCLQQRLADCELTVPAWCICFTEATTVCSAVMLACATRSMDQFLACTDTCDIGRIACQPGWLPLGPLTEPGP